MVPADACQACLNCHEKRDGLFPELLQSAKKFSRFGGSLKRRSLSGQCLEPSVVITQVLYKLI